MDSLWLEIALDANNQAKITFACLNDKMRAESFAQKLCNRRTGPRFFMKNHADFAMVLAQWSKILEEKH